MLVLSSCIFLVITLKYLIKYITKLTLKNLQKYYEIFEDVGCIHQIPTLFSAPQSFWKRNRRIIRKKHTAVTFWYWRHVIPAHCFRHVAHSTHRGTRSAINGTANPKDTKSHCSLTPVESSCDPIYHMITKRYLIHIKLVWWKLRTFNWNICCCCRYDPRRQ